MEQTSQLPYGIDEMVADLRVTYSSTSEVDRKSARKRMDSLLKSSQWFSYLTTIVGMPEIEGNRGLTCRRCQNCGCRSAR